MYVGIDHVHPYVRVTLTYCRCDVIGMLCVRARDANARKFVQFLSERSVREAVSCNTRASPELVSVHWYTWSSARTCDRAEW